MEVADWESIQVVEGKMEDGDAGDEDEDMVLGGGERMSPCMSKFEHHFS